MPKKTKIMLAAAILIIVAVGIYFALRRFFPDSLIGARQSISPFPSFSSAPQTTITAKGLLREFNDTAIGILPGADNKKILYFSPKSGQFMAADQSGSASMPLSSRIFNNITASFISAKKNEVIIVSNDRYTRALSYFNWDTDSLKTLDVNVESPVWSPDYAKIAYLFANQQNSQQSVQIANPDGSGWRKVADVNIQDARLSWPHNSFLAIEEKPSSLYKGSLYILNIANRTLKTIVVNIPGLMARWSPDGAKVLISDSSGNLVVFNSEGKIINAELTIRTLAWKCAFQNEKTLICASPKNISGFTLPDDWLKNKIVFQDELIIINLETNEARILDTGAVNFDAKNLVVSSDGTLLYFFNKVDGKTYYLEL